MDEKRHYIMIKGFNLPEDVTMIRAHIPNMILRQIKLKLENITKEWMKLTSIVRDYNTPLSTTDTSCSQRDLSNTINKPELIDI